VGSACLLAAALYAFIQYGFLFNFPLALLVFFSGGLVSYLLKSFFEEKLRKKMQSSFAQYVPPDVVRRVSKSNHPPRLGGELIEATVLFLDLRGFTAFTESLKDRPELMVKVISTIMNEVTQRLLASGATIDKYIGDAVMAFWNAPEKQENHLARALYAACQIIEDLDLIRNQIYALDEGLRSIQIDFGIGVASGEVTVGNMGSSFRFNYTVLGDAVNTAARLEGMTKSLGDAILVAGISSAQEISFGGRAIELISRGDLEVRGKTEKIPVFAAKFANEGPRR
jgi:adenylate cyclase